MKVLSRSKFNEKKNRIIHALPYFRLIWFLFLVLIILVGVKLYFTNLLATSGVRLTATTQKIEKLEKDKARLENKISALGAVSRLKEEAKKLGLVYTKRIEVLSQPEPLAQKP